MPLIGARAGEVVVTDTAPINLLKVLSAALRVQEEEASGRKVTVPESNNFPADPCIVEGLTDILQRGYRLYLVGGPEQLPVVIDTDTAVMMLNHINYKIDYLYNMREVTRLVHENGAPAIWDPAHSAGTLPLDLHTAEVGHATDCTYKYLNDGLDSPAYVRVAPRLRERVWQPLSGWFGHFHRFAIEPRYQPGEGIARFLCDTRPITSLALVECGLDVLARTDMQHLRDKSLALADLFIELVESRCEYLGLTLVTLREHARRDSHISFEHAQGYAIVQALTDRGVTNDYRESGILRFSFTPLYTCFVEVWDTAQALLEILRSEAWKEPRYQVRHEMTRAPLARAASIFPGRPTSTYRSRT